VAKATFFICKKKNRTEKIMKLELYYYDQCPYCQIVLRKIQQLGLNDKIIGRNTLENQEHASFLQSKTGRTTVPCLFIDSKPMFESYDIAQWLEDNEQKIKG
jgi:glutaredoxin 3